MKISILVLMLASSAAVAQSLSSVRTGRDALGDWRSEVPGVWRKVTVADLPPPYAGYDGLKKAIAEARTRK